MSETVFGDVRGQDLPAVEDLAAEHGFRVVPGRAGFPPSCSAAGRSGLMTDREAGRGNACRVAASDEDDLCPVTDLPRYSCGHCTGADPRARERLQIGRIITRTARYPGRCDYCDGPIRPGDRIRADGGIWVHADHDLGAAPGKASVPGPRVDQP